MIDLFVCLCSFLPWELVQIVVNLIGLTNLKQCFNVAGIDLVKLGPVLKSEGGFINGSKLLACLMNDTTLYQQHDLRIHYTNLKSNKSQIPQFLGCVIDEMWSSSCLYGKHAYRKYHCLFSPIKRIEYIGSPIQVLNQTCWIDHTKIHFDGETIVIPSTVCLFNTTVQKHHIKPQTQSMYLSKKSNPIGHFTNVCHYYGQIQDNTIYRWVHAIASHETIIRYDTYMLKKRIKHVQNYYQRDYLETILLFLTKYRFVLELGGHTLNDLIKPDNFLLFLNLRRVIKRELWPLEEMGFDWNLS
jgi:hypothetical protein